MSPEQILGYGEHLQLTGHLALTTKRFIGLFGLEPSLLAAIWNRIRTQVIARGYSLRHYLATFYFMKCYPKNLSAVAGAFNCHESRILGIVTIIGKTINRSFHKYEV